VLIEDERGYAVVVRRICRRGEGTGGRGIKNFNQFN